MTPTALIADDEPLLREALRLQLATAWPELAVVAEARHGLEALACIEQAPPTVCFLDIHMPGLDGVTLARRIAGRSHIVFVTAHDQYALQAFEHGAFDYVVKPVQAARLADCVHRLKLRLAREQRPSFDEALLEALRARLQPAASPAAATAPLRWIKAPLGSGVCLVPVAAVDYFRADEKYTLIAWRDDAGQVRESFVRTPLKQLLEQLDPACFRQVHRAVIVNLAAVDRVVGEGERATLHLKHRPERLPVSRAYAPYFKAA